MGINNIFVRCDGYVTCKSSFYSVKDILDNSEFSFNAGVNILRGEIDSGIFGISYYLSNFESVRKDNIFSPPFALVDGKETPLSLIEKDSCYVDLTNKLFQKDKSVKEMIIDGLKDSEMRFSFEEIRQLFKLDTQRIERPLEGNGNERYRAMCAIGFSHGKNIFCFPWFSKMRFNYFKQHIVFLLDLLSELGKTVILPIGE